MPDRDTFPIACWVGPTFTKDAWSLLSECGFTVAPIMVKDAAEGRLGLELCQEFGLRAYVMDARLGQALTAEDADWRAVANQVVADYKEHPALAGFLITDEPPVQKYGLLSEVHAYLHELAPEHDLLINLYPNYASPDQLGVLDYDEYVKRYVDQVQPLVLSYDFYALLEDGVLRDGYFDNLATFRRESLRAQVPYWMCLQSTALGNWRVPSADDIRWQVNTALAYGCQGIIWFTYGPVDAENFRFAPISRHGLRTHVWYSVQDVNLEMQELGPWLMGLRSTNVTHWARGGDVARSGTAIPGEVTSEGRCVSGSSELVYSVGGGEYVVGEFVDEAGGPWVLVVNLSFTHSTWTTIQLRTDHTVVHEVSRQTGKLRAIARDVGAEACQVYADGVQAQFWLGPGDGRLMRLSVPK